MTRPCAIKETDPHTDAFQHAPSCKLCWLSLYSPRPQDRERLGGSAAIVLEAPARRPDVTIARASKRTPTSCLRKASDARPPFPAVRGRLCPRRQVWDWSVISKGKPVEWGSEATWMAARRDADAARADLAGEGPQRKYQAVTKRNIVFHMHPVPGKWQWHADRLRAKASLFDGRRIVACNVGPRLDAPDLIRAALPDFEVIEVPGNPNLREVATFRPLFDALAADFDPGSATLYAQSKGVTRRPHETGGHWAEALYDLYFDYWPVVAETLEDKPLAGAFLKAGMGWDAKDSLSQWHYSSSFLWFRTAELFAKPDWQRIDQFWSGIEPYPSLHFGYGDAGCFFHPGFVPSLDLYRWDYWKKTVDLELQRWKAENADRRTTYA